MGDCGPSPPTLEVPKEESIAHGIVKRFEQLETQVSFIGHNHSWESCVCVFYHILSLCECAIRISETHTVMRISDRTHIIPGLLPRMIICGVNVISLLNKKKGK